jgi:hypothetical protein
MTISNTLSSVGAYGNGYATQFWFSFDIPDASCLVVQLTDLSGITTTIPASGYTLTIYGVGQGGSIIFPSPPASGYMVTISRNLPMVQLSSISNQGGFFPETIEAALDYLTMLMQQISRQTLAALQAPVTDPVGVTLNIPGVLARINKVLVFDSNGLPAVASAMVGGVVTEANMTANAALNNLSALSVTGAKIAPATISNDKLLYPPKQFRNLVLNGACEIDIRNAGVEITPTDGIFSVDRWA